MSGAGQEPAQRGVEHQSGEQDQTGVAVGLEHRKAVVGVGDIKANDLPGEMGGEGGEAEREDQARAGEKTRKPDEDDGETIKQRQHRLGALAEQQRGGFDADQRIVFAILVGVDGVVADHPGDRAGIEQKRRHIEPAESAGPAHQRAPGKRQPEHDLRPIGDALHERIDHDDGERGDAERDGEAVERDQYGKADKRLQDEEQSRLRDAHLAGRDRPRAGALDGAVEIAIDDVVPGAAGAAHGKGADEKQNEMQDVRRPRVGRDRGERRRPPARQQQQPRADRPVEAGEPQIGS